MTLIPSTNSCTRGTDQISYSSVCIYMTVVWKQWRPR